MGLALLAARLLLAAVFFVAGIAKLVDLPGSRQAIVGFGLPSKLATPLGTLLPLFELAVAVALIPSFTAWWGAISALALLILFMVGIGYNLAQGRTPDCHCFGQLHSAPAGWPTLIRNGVLAAIAGFIVWQGPDNSGLGISTLLTSLSPVQILVLALGVLVLCLLAVEAWFLLHLLRQNGRLLLRLEALETQLAIGNGNVAPASPAAQSAPGLPIGSSAPGFQLSSLRGETAALSSLLEIKKPVLLIFSDPGCGPCTALFPEISRWQQDYAAKLTVALVSRSTPEANRAKLAAHKVANVLLQKDREIAQLYHANGTPTAVLVHPDGTIGSPPAPGADAIRALVTSTVGADRPTQASIAAVPLTAVKHSNGTASVRPASATLRVGDPAPAVTLPDLSGKPVSLSDFRNNSALVLFWNPSCGYCQRMLPELKQWDEASHEGAPKLIVISTGAVEANTSMGLRSPVLIDASSTVGRAFGANGTPMAVLVDANGNIASPVAAGAPAVMALATSQTAIA